MSNIEAGFIKVVAPTKWDMRFYSMAEEVSQWSKDPKRKVGAVTVSPCKRYFSIGYNGFPRGIKDSEERVTSTFKNNYMVHAEINALLNAPCKVEGWTLYITYLPCLECSKAIIQAGITRVVVRKPTELSNVWFQSMQEGAALLTEAGVALHCLAEEGVL